MKKLIIAAFALALIIPQASYAAWAYKGVPVTPGTDAQIAAQIAAIDAGKAPTTTPSIQDQIAFLTKQLKDLQAQLAALQTQKGGSIGVMPTEPQAPAIDRDALKKEQDELIASINWLTCKKGADCAPKVDRINAITRILGFGPTYELTKRGFGTSFGG